MKRIFVFLTSIIAMVIFGCSTSKAPIGIVLPTKDEPRWIQDQTRFMEALKKAGVGAEVLFSQGDSAKE